MKASVTPMRFIRELKWGRVALWSWTGAVFAFLYLPIVVLIVYSFNASKLNVAWGGFTLRWYGELWENTMLLQALKNSLIVATATTSASLVLGTAGGWLLHRYRFPGQRFIQTLVSVPMILPEIIMGISLLVFFRSVGLSLGFTTVIIAHVTFCFPFVVVAVQARLRGLDPAIEEAALDLGATPWQAFWTITLPNLRPALISGGLMVFTLSLDELIVTFFTASASVATLPLRIFGLVKVGLNPMLNAVSALFLLATMVFAFFSAYLKKLDTR